MNPVVRQVADEETIYYNFEELLENQDAYNAMAKPIILMEMVRLVLGLRIFWKRDIQRFRRNQQQWIYVIHTFMD